MNRGGGRQLYGTRITFGAGWFSRQGAKPLAAGAGKHRVRVAFVLQQDPWDARQVVRVVSNAVEVETKAK